MWQKAGKPQTGTVYSITRERDTNIIMQYDVVKKNKLEGQKQKLAESISHSTLFLE